MTELEYRRALKTLPYEIYPDRDLWPGIAAKLVDCPYSARSRQQRWLPIAAAAGFLGAFLVFGWQMASQSFSVGSQLSGRQTLRTPWVLHEANYMKANVDAALVAGLGIGSKQFEARSDQDFRVSFSELDSAYQVLDQALKTNPQSTFLLDRIRHLQQQRIRLAQYALST